MAEHSRHCPAKVQSGGFPASRAGAGCPGDGVRTLEKAGTRDEFWAASDAGVMGEAGGV